MKNKRSDKFNQILDLLCQGYSNEEMAKKLGYSLPMIKLYITNLIKKYKVKNRTHLACEYLMQKFANS